VIEFYGGYQVYSESGVDLTLLRENLRRSLDERWARNCRSAAFGRACEEAGRSHRGLPRKYLPQAELHNPGALLRQLQCHRVEFVVIGGLAMLAHGSAYVTNDCDLCYARRPDNLAALAQAFAPLHPCLRRGTTGLPLVLDSPTLEAGLHFSLATDLGYVDLFAAVTGIGEFPEVLRHSEERSVAGLCFRVLTLDGLLASKRAVGRRHDHLHLLELEELKKLHDDIP
jgi:hypothetical protein